MPFERVLHKGHSLALDRFRDDTDGTSLEIPRGSERGEDLRHVVAIHLHDMPIERFELPIDRFHRHNGLAWPVGLQPVLVHDEDQIA